MTQHELSLLLRDHVATDEPPLSPPGDVIARGRRRVRGRRLAGGGVATLIAGVAIGGVLLAGSGDQPGTSTVIDPATQQALDDYDARAMPDLLDREARTVFSRHVSDLGPSAFEATDGNAEPIPPEHYDKASGMSVTYGADTEHELSVSLSHARSEAEGDAREYCAAGLADGSYLECAVDVSETWVVISKLWALRPFKGLDVRFAQDTMMVVRKDELGSVDPVKLWFEREVKVIKSETFLTYVSEQVKAPTREAAESLFQIPVADLVELGLDSALVIPHPPAGQDGCPAWMWHSEGVSCDMGAQVE